MTKKFTGIVDRFEGNFAVVLIGEEQDIRADVPRSLLPEDLKEGDFISIAVKALPNKTLKTKKETQNLIEKLKRSTS